MCDLTNPRPESDNADAWQADEDGSDSSLDAEACESEAEFWNLYWLEKEEEAFPLKQEVDARA